MEHCPNQKTIDLMEKVVLAGNGKASLIDQVADISSKIDTYMLRQEDLIKEFGITNKEFYEFRSAVNATDTEKEKQGVRSRWVIGTIVIAMIALVGWVRMDIKDTKAKQAILESRQNYDSYDLMVIMDSLNIGFKSRSADSLNIEL